MIKENSIRFIQIQMLNLFDFFSSLLDKFTRPIFCFAGLAVIIASIMDFNAIFDAFFTTRVFTMNNLLHILFIYPSGWRHLFFVIAIFILTFPIVTYFQNRVVFVNKNQFTNNSFRNSIIFLAFLSLSLVLFFLEIKIGNTQFDGFDLSGIVDVGWRQTIGQKPYVDFICVLPIGFVLSIKWAYALFGIAWNSISITNSFFLIITLWWIYFLLRNLKIPVFSSLLLALMAEMMTIFMISYWWYNSTTTLLALIYILSALALLNKKSICFVSISYVLSLALLAMAKPNTALFLIVPVTGILLNDKKLTVPIISYTIAAIIIDMVILNWNGYNPLEICRGYLDATERAWPTKFFVGVILPEKFAQAFEFFIACLCFLVFLKEIKFIVSIHTLINKITPEKAIYLVSIVSGFYQWGTSREIAAVAYPLIFIPIYLSMKNYLWTGSNSFLKMKSVFYSTIVFFIIIGLTFGMLRYRIQLVGPFFETISFETENIAPFFNSCSESPSFNETIRDISIAIREKPQAKYFFGPRLEFAYCAFNIKSPEHLPLYWFKGSSYKSIKEPTIVATWKSHCFDIAIFKKNDFMRLPAQIRTYLKQNYVKVDRNQISIFTLNKLS